MTSAEQLKGARPRRALPPWRRLAGNLRDWVMVLARPPRTAGAARPPWRAPLRLWIGLATALVVVVAAMFLVDATLITQARHLPAWLVAAFHKFTEYGKSGYMLWPLGLALTAIAALTSPALTRLTQLVLAAVVVRLGFLFLAIGIPGLIVSIVKRIIGRARPFVTDGQDPFAYLLFVWRSDYASLPSGHATTAFAALVAFGALWPRLAPALWLFALSMSASRIIVLAHHPSDVIAGAVVGTLGALLVRDWFAARGLGFVIDGDGRVQVKPGPSFARVRRAVRELFA